MLGAELTEHLGYEQGEVPPPVQPNRRNGNSRKTVKGESGTFEIDVASAFFVSRCHRALAARSGHGRRSDDDS
jgi:hypothetical protein